MSPYTFSRIRLRDEAQGSQAFWRSARNIYDAHGTIWRFFSDGSAKNRDFLYRLEMQGSSPVIYAVSASPPVAPNDLWIIEQKEYAPVLDEGQRLAFSLRANPIRSKRDAAGKQHRHDVVMDAKTALVQGGVSPDALPPLADLVHSTGVAWLSSRAETHGFTVEEGEVRADGYQQHRFTKWNHKGSGSLSSIDFTGVLTVTDPERFEQALYGGIGPAKGFGCGLILVRPV